MISGVSVPLLGLVDTSVVGRLSNSEALGAVALGSWLFDLLYWSFGFLRMGTTGLVAQARGREHTSELRPLLARPLLIGLSFGLIIIVVGHMLSTSALGYVGGDASAELTQTADHYFRSRLWGGPAVLMNYAFLGWLLGMGKVRLALASQLSLNGVNMILSLWWGRYWGVEGVGAASATSQWIISLSWGSYIWWRLCPPLSLNMLSSSLRDRVAWKTLAALNLDLWVRTSLLLAVFGLMNATGARLGALTLSANALLLHLQSLQAFILDGFAHGAEVIIGERLGRKDLKGYRDALRAGIEWTFITALIISLLYALTATPLLQLLTHHSEVLREVDHYLIWAIISPLISAPCFLLDGVMIGATESGSMRRGMIISALIFGLGLMVLVPLWGNHGLWLALMLFMSARFLTLIPQTIRRGRFHYGLKP